MSKAEEEEQLSYMKQLLSTAGTFKWPDEVLLYCLPPEQELLVDKACRVVFETYLRLSELGFTVKTAANAKSMSPDGTTPFLVFQIKNQPMIWTKFEQLVSFLSKQGLGVGRKLEDSDRVDQEAYLSLIRMKILPAQHYQTWANWNNLSETFMVNGHGLSWPLGPIVPFLSLFSYMWNYWSDFSRSQLDIMRDFERACDALSQRLGKEAYFFKERLTVLDVVVYGNLQAILTMHLPSPELIMIVQQHGNLAAFCRRVSELPGVAQTSIPPLELLDNYKRVSELKQTGTPSLEWVDKQVSEVKQTGTPSLEQVDKQVSELPEMQQTGTPSLERVDNQVSELPEMQQTGTPSLERVDKRVSELTEVQQTGTLSLEQVDKRVSELTEVTPSLDKRVSSEVEQTGTPSLELGDSASDHNSSS